MDQFMAFMEKFGFPVALCCVLMWFIYKMVTSRIALLEKIISEQGKKITVLEEDRLARAEQYGHSLKAMAGQFANESREIRRIVTELLNFMRKLTDALNERPCLKEYHPQTAHQEKPRTPSSTEIPADPSKTETAKEFKHG